MFCYNVNITSAFKSTNNNPEQLLADPSITLEELKQLMIEANVPVNEYGRGEAKDIDDLQKEISDGECTIAVAHDGTLTRQVKPVWVNVLCRLGDGRIMVLREEKQVFKDGRVRKRNLPSSLGEKLKAGESTDDAALRALKEEIGVIEVTTMEKVHEESRTFTPPTFPGIKSTYSSTFYDVVIPESAYDAEGYVEYQLKKDNYYVWDQQTPARE